MVDSMIPNNPSHPRAKNDDQSGMYSTKGGCGIADFVRRGL